MIVVSYEVDGEEHRLSIRGHAESGPQGQDRVCAMASGVFQACLLGLRDLADRHPAHIAFDGPSSGQAQEDRRAATD